MNKNAGYQKDPGLQYILEQNRKKKEEEEEARRNYETYSKQAQQEEYDHEKFLEERAAYDAGVRAYQERMNMGKNTFRHNHVPKNARYPGKQYDTNKTDEVLKQRYQSGNQDRANLQDAYNAMAGYPSLEGYGNLYQETVKNDPRKQIESLERMEQSYKKRGTGREQKKANELDQYNALAGYPSVEGYGNLLEESQRKEVQQTIEAAKGNDTRTQEQELKNAKWYLNEVLGQQNPSAREKYMNYVYEIERKGIFGGANVDDQYLKDRGYQSTSVSDDEGIETTTKFGTSERKSAHQLKEEIKKETGLDEQGFNRMAQYAQEVFDEDYANWQRENAAKRVNTGNALANVGGAVMNTGTAILEDSVLGVPRLISQMKATEEARYYPDSKAPVNTYGVGFRGANESAYMQDETQRAIENAVGGKAGQVAGWGYGIGSSMARSLITGGMWNALGAAGGLAGTASKVASAAAFSSGAYNDTAQKAAERGLTAEQTQMLATGAAAAEAVFEELSLEKLKDVYENAGGKEARSLIVNALMQAGFEGSEEINTELANKILDIAIAGDKSEYAQDVARYTQQYLSEGMSQEEAEEKAKDAALSNMMVDMGMAFLGGFVSGAGLGATGHVAGRMNYAQQIDQMVEDAGGYGAVKERMNSVKLQSPEANKYAQKAIDIADTLQKKEEAGEKIKQKEKVSLYEAIDDADKAEMRHLNNGKTTQEKWTEEDREAARGEAVEGKTVKRNEGDTVVLPESEENIPEEYREKEITIDAEEVATTMTAAASKESPQALVEAYKESQKSTDPAARKTGEEMYGLLSRRMVSEGVTSRDQLDKLEAKATPEEAYKAGYNNETAQYMDERSLIAYNEGKKARIEEKGSQTAVSKEASLEGLTVTGDGKVQQNGNSINVSDIEDTAVRKLAVNAVNQVSPVAKQNYISIYKSDAMGKPAGMYDTAFDRFFSAGASKAQPFADVMKRNEHMKSQFSESMLKKIYDLGASETGQARQEGTVKKGSGTVTDLRNNKKTGKKYMPVLEHIAKTMGIDIEVRDDLDKQINGSFTKGTSKLVFNANTKKGFQTIFHEAVGEFSEAWNDAGMKEVQDTILKYLIDTKGEDAVNLRGQTYQEAYREFGEKNNTSDKDKSFRDALDEMVNDTLWELFSTEKGMQDFADWLEKTMPEQKKTVLQKVADFLNRVIVSMKDLLNGSDISERDRKLAEMELDAAQDLRDMVLDVLSGAVENYKTGELKAKTFRELTPEDAESFFGGELFTEEERKETNDTRQSIELNDKMSESALRKLRTLATRKENPVTNVEEAVLKTAIENRKEVAEALKEMESILPKDIAGNIFTGNASYGKSGDHAMVCVRSLVSGAFMDKVSEEVGHPLSIEEQLVASQILAEITGNQMECTYCYVKTDRAAYRAFFGNYFNQYEGIVKGVRQNKPAYEKDIWTGYKDFLNGRKDTNEMKNRYRMIAELAISGKDGLKLSDLSTAKTRDEAKKRSKAIADIVKDSEKYSQSASWQKLPTKDVKGKKLDYVAYNGNILRWGKKTIDALNDEYGLRMYSYSDYTPAFLLEDMQVVTDAAVQGLKMLSYTKDISFVDVFGGTGMGINISTFGYKGSDGNIHEDQMQGAPWEDAKKAREKYENVGVTFVAVNDDIVRWALKQDWIDTVIPYHLVRTGTETAAAYGYQNYKGEQEDRKTKDWTDKNLKHIPPTVHENDFDKYMDALDKNNLTARFARFLPENDQTISKEMYMKLVNETRKSYKDMNPVQPVFDMDAARKEIAKLEKLGYGGLQTTLDRESQEDLIDDQVQKAKSAINLGVRRRNGKLVTPDGKTVQFEGNGAYSLNVDGENEYDERYVVDGDEIKLVKGEKVELNKNIDEARKLIDSVKTADGYEAIRDKLLDLGYVLTYRGMQIIDGRLYSPMNDARETVTNGVKGGGLLFDEKTRVIEKLWNKAEVDLDPSHIDSDGKYKLKTGKTRDTGASNDTPAAYNPYMHSSNIVLNDQFSSAYDRTNMVTVVCLAPAYENRAKEDATAYVAAGPRAKKKGQTVQIMAKDHVGWADWKSGTFTNEIVKQKKGFKRDLFLSRWLMPVKIMDVEHVADLYLDAMEGTTTKVPWNVVPRNLLEKLVERGAPIKWEGNSSTFNLLDENRKATISMDKKMYDFIKSQGVEPKGKVKVVGGTAYSIDVDSTGRKLSEKQQSFFKDSKVVDENGNLKVMYHGSKNAGFYVFDPSKSDDKISMFFTDRPSVARGYFRNEKTDKTNGYIQRKYEVYGMKEKNGKGIYPVYLNLKNPMVVDAKGAAWNEITEYGHVKEQAMARDLLNEMEGFVQDHSFFGEPLATHEMLDLIRDGSTFAAEVYNMVEYYADNIRDIQWGKETQKKAKELDEAIEHFDKDQVRGILEEQGYDDEEIEGMSGKDAFLNAIDELIEYKSTRTYAKEAKDQGYDGVIFENIYDNGAYDRDGEMSTVAIAFEGNQIKSVYNENPTEYNDIRFSINIPQSRYSVYEDAFEAAFGDEDLSFDDVLIDENGKPAKLDIQKENIKEVAPILERGEKALKGQPLSKKRIYEMAQKYKQQYGSGYSARDLANNLETLFKYLNENGYADKTDMMQVMKEIAMPVIEGATASKDEREIYDDFKAAVKGYTVRLNDQQKQEVRSRFGTVSNWVRATGNNVHVNDKEGQSLDTVWSEMADRTNGVLNPYTEDVNQPLALADAFEALLPCGRTPISEAYGMNPDDMAYDLGLQMVQDFFGEKDAGVRKDAKKAQDDYRDKVKKSFDKKMEKVKEDQKALKKKLREEYQAKLDKELQKQEGLLREDYEYLNEKYRQEAIRKEKQAYQIALAKARMRQTFEKRADRQEARKHRDEIQKSVNEMRSWIVDPTEKKHIPKELAGPVAEFITAFDFVTPEIKKYEQGKHEGMWGTYLYMYQSSDGSPIYKFVGANTREEAFRKVNEEIEKQFTEGTGSKYRKTWQERMRGLSDLLTQIKDDEDGEFASLRTLIDPDAEAALREILRDNGRMPSVSQLSAKELKSLSNILKNMKNAINKQNEFFIKRRNASIEEAANRHISFMEGKKEHRDLQGVRQRAWHLLNVSMITPSTWFHMIGADDIYDRIREGMNKRTMNIKAAEEYTDGILKGVKGAGKWRTEKHKLKDLEGRELVLSTAQIMSLYELSKRPDAMRHFIGGFVPDKIGGKQLNSTKAYHFTNEQIRELIDSLTEEQKKVADGMQQYLAVQCADQGNEVSEQMFGYKKYTDPHYFPMRVDPSSIGMSDKSAGQELFNAITNSGFTKATKDNAKNALMLEDIFSVYTRHITEMATYNGYAMPLSDTLRWFNYKEIVKDENMRSDTKNVQNAIKRVGGMDYIQYFKNLYRDINGETSGGTETEFANAMISRYKAAAVGANLRVAIQQPTAYMRAAAVIDPKYLLKAQAAANVNVYKMSKDAKHAQENNPIAYWKSKGYYDNSMGQSLDEIITGQKSAMDVVRESTSILAQLGDDFTWGMIYRAVEYEQAAKHKDMDQESQEFRDLVNKRMDDVVDQTQVVDSVLHRSQFMRSKDTLVKIEAAFQAEPTKSYNMLYRAVMDGDKKGIARAAVVFILTAIECAAAASVMDAFRNDDDEKEWTERYLEALTGLTGDEESIMQKIKGVASGNIGSGVNVAATIPYMKDVFSMIDGYDVERLDTAGIANLLKSAQDVVKYFNGESSKTGYGITRSTVKALSQITGVPGYGMWREVETIHNAMFENWQTKQAGRYDGLKKAINKDGDIAGEVKTIKEELMKSGKTEKEANTAIKSSITSKYKAEMVETKSADLKNKLIKAYTAAGDSREDAIKKIDKWFK